MLFHQEMSFLKRLGIFMGFIILLLLLANGIVGKGGYLELRKMEDQNRQLKEKITKYKQQNEHLLQEIDALKTNPEAIRKVAREDYNMVGKGEIKITASPLKPAARDLPPKASRKSK
jgi:cell division protein FtsB